MFAICLAAARCGPFSDAAPSQLDEALGESRRDPCRPFYEGALVNFRTGDITGHDGCCSDPVPAGSHQYLLSISALAIQDVPRRAGRATVH